MATMVTRGNSPLASSSSLREKGNRNKRKFRADPSFADSNIIIPPPFTDCINYEFFSMDKVSENPTAEQHSSFCDVCRALSCSSKDDLGFDELHEVDWSSPTENELEDIILNNLNEIFNEAIKMIVSYGYTEEIASNAVLNYGICYRCKYTVSNIVDNALLLLRTGREVDSSPRENAAEDLQMLARSVLADMVNFLRAVRPFFSAGDALWCLLLCDLNVSHAYAVDCDGLSTAVHEESSGSSNVVQLEPDASCSITASQAMPEVEVSVSRKSYHVGSSKRESVTREKAFHSKANVRANKNGGVGGGVLKDEKVKSSSLSSSSSSSNSSGVGTKCTSSNLSNALGSDSLQTDGYLGLSLSDAASSGPSPSMKTVTCPASIAVANTDLSLSLLPSTHSSSGYGIQSDVYSSRAGLGSEKINGNLIPQDKKDELLLKLIPRARELEIQKQEWTEWAQHKVMQAAHRLSKDKNELQTLRLEKEEVARLKKEKKILEENAKKKLIEMENALSKAGSQIEEANITARKLDVENLELRKEMEAAQLRAEESAASCQEVSKREMKILKKIQSWDREKSSLQEEFTSEKRKLSQLQQQLKGAKEHLDLVETRWKHEHKAKHEVLLQLNAERNEREQIEALGKAKENAMMIEAENDLQRFKDDIRRLERQLTQLRLATDSSNITAFGWGADGSTYASRLITDGGANGGHTQTITKFLEADGGVERERECVMCLSEEMSVVFLPCAHQVVCSTCNELHERQGMKDCPSCRTTIQRRIEVRPAEALG